MKGLIKMTMLVGGLFFLASCEATNSGVYGTNNGRVYRAPDGGVYRQGDIYSDRNGNIYRNGSLYKRTNTYRNLPPGQAKKIYGGSARDYAPGQNKYKDHDHKGKKHKGKGKGKHRH